MTTEEMVYSLTLKADKLSSKSWANIKIPAIIYLLNEGMMSLIKKRYGTNNNYKASFEEIQKRKDEFQRIIVPDELINAVRVDDETYTADLSKLKKEYMFLLRLNGIAEKECCGERRLKGILTQVDDLDLVEGSSLRDSSFEWGEMAYRLAADQVRMRSDGTFKVKKVRMDYLRYPAKIDIKGYEHFDKTPSVDSNCELPRFMHDDIVDEALFAYSSSFSNADLRARLAKLSSDE